MHPSDDWPPAGFDKAQWEYDNEAPDDNDCEHLVTRHTRRGWICADCGSDLEEPEG